MIELYYIFIFLLTCFLALNIENKDIHYVSSWVLILASIFVGLIHYIRDIKGDSYRYELFFNHVSNDTVINALTTSSYEIGYVLWNIVNSFHGNPRLFFALTSVFMFLLISHACIKLIGIKHGIISSMLFVAFPWFAQYSASGLRQGLALSFMIISIVGILKGEYKRSFIFSTIAILFHDTAIVVFLAWYSVRLSFRTVIFLYISSVVVAISGIGDVIVRTFIDVNSLSSSEQIYFSEIESYKTGFRLDFTLISMFPMVCAALTNRVERLNSINLNFIKIFIILNSIMQFFSFIPYYDRFAAYSWFLIPLLVCSLLKSANNNFKLTLIIIFAFLNVLAFYFYNWKFYFS